MKQLGNFRYYVILMPLLTLMLVSWSGTKKSAGAPAGSTGGAGETAGSCAQMGCHDDNSVNSGTGSVAILLDGGLTTYEASRKYTVSVTVTQVAINKFGFQLLALENAGNTNIGDLSLLDPFTTQTFSPDTPSIFNLREYVTHTKDGTRAKNIGSKQWDFYWTAPPGDVGDITLYAAGMAANNDQDLTGDRVYNSLLTLKFTVPSGINTLHQEIVQVLPTNFQESFQIFLPSAMPGTRVICYDMRGKIVAEEEMDNVKSIRFYPDSDLPQGLYIINIVAGNKQLFTTKIIKQ